MSHCIRLRKQNRNKICIHIHIPYLHQNPPTPIHLCEQDSVLQKFIKIYNLPRTASVLLTPCLGRRLLYLYIKYISPVKLLCWEHSGDFCSEGEVSEGRVCLCITELATQGKFSFARSLPAAVPPDPSATPGPGGRQSAEGSVPPTARWWGTGNRECCFWVQHDNNMLCRQ